MDNLSLFIKLMILLVSFININFDGWFMKWVLIILLLLVIAGCSESDDVDENQTINNSTNITQNDTVSDDLVNQNEGDNETEPIIQIGACHDSDGGKIYDELGYVRLNNSGNLDYMDSCISDRHLREYYCNEESPGTVTFEVYPCSPDICDGGVCVSIGNESS